MLSLVELVRLYLQIILEDPIICIFYWRSFIYISADNTSLLDLPLPVTWWTSFIVHRKQKMFLSVYADGMKTGWKEAECGSYVEELDEKR